MENRLKRKGIDVALIKELSKIKSEPQWMLDFRLESFRAFNKIRIPKISPSINSILDSINYNQITFFKREVDSVSNDWNDVPSDIKDIFEEIGIPEAERKFLAGVSSQFESEVVYHATKVELDNQGVIFLDTDTALKKYPELFKEYFNTIVDYKSNKYTALNGAVWSGGSFIYVPKGVIIDKPLQSYFRINARSMGQFERTLIIVDEGASLNYVEGCTAPLYTEDSLHAATVEIVVKKNAKCRYSTIQNWSTNVINLVTKRAYVYENGLMEWIDGNIGSKLNIKYPACYLIEPGASGHMISIAVASENMFQDAGSIMIHKAPYTNSNIISKSIVDNNGINNFRGLVRIEKDALYSRSIVKCDTLILSDLAKSDTFPKIEVKNNSSKVDHEASVSKISKEQLNYLRLRGLSEDEASKLIVTGFIEVFSSELPMEYAVELNRLIKLDIK